MKEEVTRLKCESETMRRQMRAQDEAIQGAHHLKKQVDEMILEYEQLKRDKVHHLQKIREQGAELEANVNGRQKAETELEKVRREYEQFRLM